MNQVNWNLKEVFYFPESFGVPCNSPKVTVKPQVEFQQLNGVCSLHGVYHIAANVEFQPGECEHHGTSEWISIEDLDLNGEVGYFEYAVPLFVELPPTYVHGNVMPEIQLTEVNAAVSDDHTLQIGWNVTCTYESNEKSQPQESPTIESSSSVELTFAEEKPVVKENEKALLPFFLQDLKDGYSVYELK
jgi:hypothetical protein